MQTEELLSAPQTPWWTAFGSQPLTTDSLSEDTSHSFPGVTPEKELGGGKSSKDLPKPHVDFAMQPACFEFGFAQPMIYTKLPHVEQYYGVVSTYGSQRSSSQVMVPLKMETEEDVTIYVNSKQYNGIIRRRKSRAKAEKLSRCRSKSYMHHSRHLHAMRRPRGSGGRFLNTKKADATKQSKPNKSQSSEVFHPEKGIMNSSREENGPNRSGSQVTSLDYFLSSSVYSPGTIKWNAAALDIGCCNLNN